MFVRIVKMGFDKDYIPTFLSTFEAKKNAIRHSTGCQLLELYRDKNDPTIFFTYSYWASETDLENYRNSELFKGVWALTKKGFNKKPEAWSVNKEVVLT